MSSGSLSRSEIDGKLQKLDQKLDKLRRDYEQFFVGSRERPPRNERKQVERLVRELEQAQVSNTSQQFRLRSLVQRFTSYRQKWNRIQRQIEEGTYKPHQERAKKRVGDDESSSEDSPSEENRDEENRDDDNVFEVDDDLDDIDLEGLEEELAEMDHEGEFEKHVETERMSNADFEEADRRREERGGGREGGSSGDGGGDEEREEKRQKIREMQEKLGISSGSGGSDSGGDRQATGDSGGGRRRPDPREETSDSGSELPTGGAKREDLEKMRQKLDRNDGSERRRRDQTTSGDTGREETGGRRSGRADRGSSRRRRPNPESGDDDEGSSSDDDDEPRVDLLYRRLVAAKRKYGEPTDHLDRETFAQSLVRRRREVAENHDAERVEFEVVVKDRSVYLQPRISD